MEVSRRRAQHGAALRQPDPRSGAKGAGGIGVIIKWLVPKGIAELGSQTNEVRGSQRPVAKNNCECGGALGKELAVSMVR